MFYLKNANLYAPHKYLIIETPGLTDDIRQLEYDTGLFIDDRKSLIELTGCIKNLDTAESDLEYYCLDIASSKYGQNCFAELDAIVYFLSGFGKVLFNHLRQLGVYQNGILPYSFKDRRLDSICLMRTEALLDEIKKELYLDGLYSKTKFSTIEYRRNLPRFC